MATRGCLNTLIVASPSAASTPISRDVSCCPARSTVSPRDVGARVTDVLAGRERAPDLHALAGFRFEQLGMLHHEDRIGAARQHAAGGDRRRESADHVDGGTTPGASTSALVRALRGVSSMAPKVSCACNANPSTLERSKPGTSTSATTSSASTRRNACVSGTNSLPRGARRRCSRNRMVASSRVTTLRNWVWPDSLPRGHRQVDCLDM